MRRPVDVANPARYTLLGLLLEGPRHGYDLARAFAPATPLGSAVHLGSSHLYGLLAQLERDGLVVGQREDQGIRPPRRVFQLTDAGRAEVLRWVDEPVARPRDMLLDFPLKLYLAQRLDPVRAAALITHQRALFAAFLAELEGEPAPEDPGVDQAFMGLLREGRIARTQAMLGWLDRCDAVVTALGRVS
jgi:DNA-binding PadR family transcriptional regulator